MKLLLENWRCYLNEETEGEGMLLYHATCFPPESFVGGIDPTRAKGYGQGEGFYFFTNKAYAVSTGKDAAAGNLDKEVPCPEDSTGVFIVVSDEPVTPENFDIDYEAYAGGFAGFVANNKEYFEPRKDNYGFGIAKIRDSGITIYLRPGKKGRKTIGRFGSIDRHRAVIVAQMAKDLAKESPEMFKRFEQEILPKADTIKYNGKEKIIPLRIEDIEGNVIWSR